MADSSSEKSVIAALGVNTILTLVKGVAYAMTGSGAMLSEAVHSFADLMNQALLLVGIRKASKTPDDTYQYGYGRERFVWALMSAVGIFFMGCAFTIMHGVQALNHPEPSSGHVIALSVLGFSLLLDLGVFVFAFRSLWSQKGQTPFLVFLKTQADPPEVAVLLEDGAACLGVMIAIAAIGLSAITGFHAWDAIGSIMIGVLLGIVAIWLIERNLKLITGPSIPSSDEQKLRQILRQSALIKSIDRLRTQAIDNDTFDVELDVQFSSEMIAQKLGKSVWEKYPSVSSEAEMEVLLSDYTEQVLNVIGHEIDDLEEKLAEADDAFRFVEIEVQHKPD